jgi:hypothetical protein
VAGWALIRVITMRHRAWLASRFPLVCAVSRRERHCARYGAVMAFASLVISLLALVVAGTSALYARRQSVAQDRATTIEDDRRHDELTPVFEASCEVSRDPGDSATLKIVLAGGIDALDEVVVTIQDESGTDHWSRGLPVGVTQEQAEVFVWGPWEFDTNANAQVVSNRQTRPRSYSLPGGKNWDVLTLAATRPGPWMTGTAPDKWRNDRRQQPIRLMLTCRRGGHGPWFVPLEVQPRYRKTARVRVLD